MTRVWRNEEELLVELVDRLLADPELGPALLAELEERPRRSRRTRKLGGGRGRTPSEDEEE